MTRSGALAACLRGSILVRSIATAILVGTLLTAINQGDVILAGEMPPIWKIALTYFVPFAVATYGAYAALTVRS